MSKRTLTVVNVTLQSAQWDHDQEVHFAGRRFRLVRVGTAGDLKAAEDLVWQWSLKSDAIAVSGAREALAAGLLLADVSRSREVVETTSRVPVRDGAMLADIFSEWAIRHVQAEMPGYFTNARTIVLGAGNHERTVKVLREYTENIEFLDPDLRTTAPLSMQTTPVLSHAAELGMYSWRKTPGALKHLARGPATWVSDQLTHRAAKDADVIVGTFTEIDSFGLEDLAGKTVITNAVSEERLAALAAKGVLMVVDATPQPFDTMVVTATFEAMAAAMAGKTRALRVDDLVTMIEKAGLRPRIMFPNGDKRKSRFAFVIHPLSQQYFRNVQPLATLVDVPGMAPVVEKAAAHLPPFIYSHVTGITSPTGAEAEGWLISVGGTPKEMLAHKPEFTYSRLLDAAELSRKLGAQIMGLGAFTKVVGDAGVTVAKQAPLPVTTGNSYSASGALWAAAAAMEKLGFVRTDEDGLIHGKAMVVGASGAIGSVCARLLALVADEVWLVSPETAKLLNLKQEIEAEGARAKLHVATQPPDDALGDMDVIVTATSAAGTKVLDIMKVKPGCVITDVARPLDMSAEDVAKRPDVLVIESGEIELPGQVKMRDIGLPDGVAYACLAETVVLALEGRYETFTVGRNIEWPKVREIYRLGLKHGMKLATISGVNGVYSDADFDRIRAAAAQALAERDAMREAEARAAQEAPKAAPPESVDPLSVRCPRCRADIGAACVTGAGKPAKAHVARLTRARAAISAA